MNSSNNRQLPGHLVAPEFGEVNVRDDGRVLHIQFSILMEPQGKDAEGWQTGVALDGSASMKGWYGRQLMGQVPPELEAIYVQKGWVTQRIQDGKKLKIFQKEAYADAIALGHLRMSPNIIESFAQDFISYLAGNLDADGGTTVIYWACGDGSGLEVVGDFDVNACKSLEISGPSKVSFGNGTQLLPAVRYFAERFSDAERGIYIFITDGRLDDLEPLKKYTVELARQVESGARNPLKCVLIGVGQSIDEGQMEELDDLHTGTSVDIWDHKIAKEMRSMAEIFAEVVSENQIVAPLGAVFDSSGNLVKQFSDGLPAKIEVQLPRDAAWFELEVMGQRIRQRIDEMTN
jgi:hypothetical protein